MPQQHQPIRVVVEKKGGCLSGCGTTLAVMVLLGLTIQYWYIALGLLAVAVGIAMARSSKQRERTRHRPGLRDPWLNEVAVALADLGLTEIARNTGAQLGGVPIEGDIGLQADGLKVHVTRFATGHAARQAELGLRAQPAVRDAISKGLTAITTTDEVVYVGNGRGGVVDDFRLDEVVRLVARVPTPPPFEVASPTPATPAQLSSTRMPLPTDVPVSTISPDALEQLRKLGELRAGGVLSDAEFDAKKAELLRRI